MARPIAYNTSHPLSGSITQTQGGGIISYTIDGEGRDYSSFAGKKWVPSADGAASIIFVTDSFTQVFIHKQTLYLYFMGVLGLVQQLYYIQQIDYLVHLVTMLR